MDEREIQKAVDAAKVLAEFFVRTMAQSQTIPTPEPPKEPPDEWWDDPERERIEPDDDESYADERLSLAEVLSYADLKKADSLKDRVREGYFPGPQWINGNRPSWLKSEVYRWGEWKNAVDRRRSYKTWKNDKENGLSDEFPKGQETWLDW